MSIQKAVLLNAVLWCLVHLSDKKLMDFNYGTEYYGAPITGIIMFLILCICSCICLSYITLKTGNCLYASIFHGAFNVISDLQITSDVFKKSLLGPSPTGLIGMSVFILLAAYIFIKKLKEIPIEQ